MTYRGIETFTTASGSRIPVELACAAVVVDGVSTGAVVVFQDISERLRQERRKDDFVGFASHELRNPLTSIKGFSQWLANRAQDQPAAFEKDTREAILTLVQEADRMESIIDLFLDLARIDSDRLTMELEPVNLTRLLDEEVGRLGHRYPAAACTIDVPGEPLIAVLDDNRMRQIVGNLLDNAAKYAGDRAIVRVKLEAGVPDTLDAPAWAVIRIKDNGPGIPADDQPYLFNRYYRGQQDTSNPRQGLGVGLYITKQLADRLGCTLTFESVPGTGTEFVLRVPLATLDDGDSDAAAPVPDANPA